MESFPQFTLTSAPSRLPLTRVTVTYGQKEDGESTLCAPLFQIQEEEEDKTEEKQKENEDIEDGYK